MMLEKRFCLESCDCNGMEKSVTREGKIVGFDNSQDLHSIMLSCSVFKKLSIAMGWKEWVKVN